MNSIGATNHAGLYQIDMTVNAKKPAAVRFAVASDEQGAAETVYIPRVEFPQSAQATLIFLWPSTNAKGIGVRTVTWLDDGTTVKCDALPTPISKTGPTQTQWSVDDGGLAIKPEMPAWPMSLARGERTYAQPNYPDEAKAEGVQGSADIAVTIGPGGAVLAVWVFRSSGSPLLDGEGIGAVKRSKFVEPQANGGPTAATFITTYSWLLH